MPAQNFQFIDISSFSLLLLLNPDEASKYKTPLVFLSCILSLWIYWYGMVSRREYCIQIIVVELCTYLKLGKN